ncbi:MAG: glutamate-5-semialdehyde dehydrogenase [Actinobacteria bacterium]|nr:glutamate-5-semialdehyde dehydrogenase [Actinomycetota bacterium]
MAEQDKERGVRVDIKESAAAAKRASRHLVTLSSAQKNRAILEMAEALERRAGEILQENAEDFAAGRKKGLSSALLDRLLLDEERVRAMAQDLRRVAALPDPVGEIVEGWRTAEGLEIRKVRVPFGVVAVIYEARPNVTVDAAALCLKTGNAVMLRGGGDAYHSNRILAEVITGAVLEADLPGDAIQFVTTRDREVLIELLQLTELVDLVIPRGGEQLKQFLVEHSRVPVIYAAGGNCHVYVDRTADLNQAVDIVVNAKVQRPGVCNAAETLLVHEAVAKQFLPRVVKELTERQVKLYVDKKSKEILGERGAALAPATEKHYATEFLALEMAVKVVTSLDEAIAHVNEYGTGHSEAIVTQDLEAGRRFSDEVDAAAVYVNASTRFTDGAVFGLGAEIGISTQKLHARGPLALKELTSTKYIVTGRGHIR